MSDQTNGSDEAALLALMRADRVVQKRRRNRQELIDLDATEEAGSAAMIERFTRRRP